jgi:NADH:ubiquinone oxidoreductase subunit 3 (subunit A)
MSIAWLGLVECLVILLVVAVVAAFAFRAGYFRGKGR